MPKRKMMAEPDRSMVPPHSREAEQALLGSLLIDPDAILHANPHLETNDFYEKDHQELFAAILELHAKGEPHNDLLALAVRMNSSAVTQGRAWDAYLVDLVSLVPTSVNIAQYCSIVREKGMRRRLLRAAGKSATLALDEEGEIGEQLAEAETLMYEVRGERNLSEVSRAPAYTAAYSAWFEAARKRPKGLAGLPTGFSELDRLLDGLQPPHQYVLAGRPSMGKSALAINIAAYLAVEKNRRVLLFSIEMSEHQIMKRLVAWHTGIDSRRKPWDYEPYQLQQIQEAKVAIGGAQLELVTAEGLSPSLLRAHAQRACAHGPLDLIVVDHLHLMKPDRSMDRPDLEIGEISRSLAGVAKHLKVPILTLAQLNRSVESRQNKRPALSDLRESGGIEENAFCVMLLYRDAYYKKMSGRPNLAELIIAKHREGPTGSIELNWDPTTTRFADRPGQMSLL